MMTARALNYQPREHREQRAWCNLSKNIIQKYLQQLYTGFSLSITIIKTNDLSLSYGKCINK